MDAVNELMREFQVLQDAAGRELESVSDDRERGVETLLRLLVRPSFDSEYVWRVLRHSDAHLGTHSPYSARCLCWRKDIDAEKFRDPVTRLRYPRPVPHTLETRTVALDTAFAESLLAQLSVLAVPAYLSNRRIGLDGVTYRLTVGDHWQKVEYQWWCDPSRSWEPLGDFARNLLSELEKRGATKP